MQGFVYGRLGSRSPTSADERKTWLDLQEFDTQPYEQLVTVLRRMGLDGDARRIAIEKQLRLLRDGDLSWSQRFTKRFFGFTIGFGYIPRRLLWWFLGIWATGYFLYRWAGTGFWVLPVQTSGEGVGSLLRPPDNYPVFWPSLYSLDLILPIVDLHQSTYWMPDASSRVGSIALAYTWFEIISGWILSTTFIALITGLVKKD